MKSLIRTKFDAASHIYTIVKLSESTKSKIEFAVGGIGGLYLATLENKKIGIS